MFLSFARDRLHAPQGVVQTHGQRIFGAGKVLNYRCNLPLYIIFHTTEKQWKTRVSRSDYALISHFPALFYRSYFLPPVASTPHFVVFVSFPTLFTCLMFAHAPGTGLIIIHEETYIQFLHNVDGDSSSSVIGVTVYFIIYFLLFKPDRKHRNHFYKVFFT